MGIAYRELAPLEIDRFREIDRSERIDEVYYLRNGVLTLEPAHYDMKGFPPGELEALIARQKVLEADGGTVLGAFDGAAIVGIASVEGRLRGNGLARLLMDVLYVSASHRGRGIASRLLELVAERARATGGKRLYISATESRHTVEFYMARGAVLADPVDPELLAKEPLDIHLELPLGG